MIGNLSTVILRAVWGPKNLLLQSSKSRSFAEFTLERSERLRMTEGYL
jgi:hypothetical protein